MLQEVYYYYGNCLYYDEAAESYYYWDWENNDYAYVDDETLALISANQLPYWDENTQQYLSAEDYEKQTPQTPETQADDAEGGDVLDLETVAALADGEEATGQEAAAAEDEAAAEGDTNVQQGGEVEGEGEGEGEEEVTGPRATAIVYNDSPSEKAKMAAMLKKLHHPIHADGVAGSLDSFKASEMSLMNRACDLLKSHLEPHMQVANQWARRPNGTFVVGNNKKWMTSLIQGKTEIKSLAVSSCAEITPSLVHLNLVQLVLIRWHAQSCSSWGKSPVPAHRTFANKCDGMICERLLAYLQTGQLVPEDSKPNLKDQDKRRADGGRLMCTLASMIEFRKRALELLNRDTYWQLPDNFAVKVRIDGSATGSSPTAANSPSNSSGQYRLTTLEQCHDTTGIKMYKLYEGQQDITGLLRWDLLEAK